MRCHLEHTVKDEAAAREDPVAPTPVGFGLNPPVDEAGDTTGDVDRLQEAIGKAKASEGEHAVVQYETKPLSRD